MSIVPKASFLVTTLVFLAGTQPLWAAKKSCGSIFRDLGKASVFDEYRELEPISDLIKDSKDLAHLSRTLDLLEPQYEALVSLHERIEAGEIHPEQVHREVDDFLESASPTYAEIHRRANAGSRDDRIRQEALRSMLDNIDSFRRYLDKKSEEMGEFDPEKYENLREEKEVDPEPVKAEEIREEENSNSERSAAERESEGREDEQHNQEKSDSVNNEREPSQEKQQQRSQSAQSESEKSDHEKSEESSDRSEESNDTAEKDNSQRNEDPQSRDEPADRDSSSEKDLDSKKNKDPIPELNNDLLKDEKQESKDTESQENREMKRDFESEKSDSEKSDSEKSDSEKSDSEKSDSEKSDSEKSESEKSESEKSDSEKSDSEKSDSEKSDSEKSDSEKSDSEKSDSEKSDSEKSESEKSESEKSDSEKSDSEKSDSEKSDSEKSDSEKSDSEKSDSEKSDSEKSESEKSDSEKSDSEKSDSEKSDSEKSDSEKSDSEKSDSEKSDSEKSDSEKSDSEKSDSEKSDSEKSEGEKSDSEKSDSQGEPSNEKGGGEPSDKSGDQKGEPSSEGKESGKSDSQGEPSNEKGGGEPSDKSGDQKGEPSSEGKESGKSDSQGEPSNEKGGGEPSDKSGDQKGEPSSEGKESGKSDSQGEPNNEKGSGEPSSESSDSSSKSSEKSSSNDELQGGSKVDPEKGEPFRPEDENSHSFSRSDEAGEQNFADKLNEYLKENLEKFFEDAKKDAEKIEDSKSEFEDLLKDFSEKPEKKDVDQEKVKDEESEKNDEMSEALEKARTELDRKDKESEKEEAEEERTSEEKKTTENRDIKPVQSEDTQEFYKNVTETFWSQLLEGYTNSKGTQKALTNFIRTLETLENDGASKDYVAPYKERAKKLKDSIKGLRLEFEDFKELSAQVVEQTFSNEGTEVYRALKFFNSIFKELAVIRDLTGDESRLLEMSEVMLVAREETSVTDENIARAFYDNLPGPLSRQEIEQRYASQDSKDGMDWSRLGADLKSGQLNDLLLFYTMHDYLNFDYNPSMIPKTYLDFIGRKTAVSESDKEPFIADEIENWKNFQHQGQPPIVSMLRFLSDDMTEMAHREARDYQDPVNPQKKKVTIVLSDVSSSMAQQEKYVIRNAITGAFLDSAQKMAMMENSEHIVYYIPFDGKPHKAEVFRNLAQFREFFNRIKEIPPGGGNSTDITAALLRAFELVKENQENGGDLGRANILLLTDGDDTVVKKTVLDARREISDDVVINVNSIVINNKNKDLDFNIDGGKNDKSVYTDIPNIYRAGLKNPSKSLQTFIEAAKYYEEAREDDVPNTDTALDLRDIFMRIHRDKSRDSGKSLYHLERVIDEARNIELDTKSKNKLQNVKNVLLNLLKSPLSREMNMSQKAELVERIEEYLDTMGAEFRDFVSMLDPLDQQWLASWIKED